MSEKKNSPNGHKEKERIKKAKKKQHRKTSLAAFEPPTDQSEIVTLSTAPRGIRRLLTVQELIFFVYGFSSNSSWLSELSEPILRLEYHVKTIKQGSSAEFSCFTPRDCDIHNGTNLS